MAKKHYLMYVTGYVDGAAVMHDVVVDASGIDIQKNRHKTLAIETAEVELGRIESPVVLFADDVNSAVLKGVDRQADTCAEVANVYNKFLKAIDDIEEESTEINSYKWRIADVFLKFQAGVLPPDSKGKLLKVIASNIPSWNRAVYGVFPDVDENLVPLKNSKADHKKRDISKSTNLAKAGINLDYALRIFEQMGVIEPVVSLLERRLQKMLDVKDDLEIEPGAEMIPPPRIEISVKQKSNEQRAPFDV